MFYAGGHFHGHVGHDPLRAAADLRSLPDADCRDADQGIRVPMNDSVERTLTVAASAGLGNRLRVLLSGMALAATTGRRFTMLWPRTEACAASFDELFTNPWPVQEVTWEEVERLPIIPHANRAGLDLLTMDATAIQGQTYNWLLAPARFPAHQPLMRRCAELLQEMQPVAEIQARVAAFQASSFRSHMIGVHLRRADMHFLYPTSAANTRPAMAAVDAYLAQHPEAGILLCTDDGAIHQGTERAAPTEGVQARFRAQYGDRVVFTAPRSLDRRDPVAIQDAVVDLWLLRQTDCFVGTARSSFSEFAVFGRAVPNTMCQSQHPLRHLLPLRRWLRGEVSHSWLARYYLRLIRPRGVKRNTRSLLGASPLWCWPTPTARPRSSTGR